MVRRPQERPSSPQRCAGPVGERRRYVRPSECPRSELPDRVPGKPAEGKDRPRVREQAELSFEVRRARRLLGRRRAVPRRSAADRSGEVEVSIAQPVPPILGGRLVRVPDRMKRPYEEGRRPIAREDPTGTVRAVGCRSETHHDQARVRVPETRDAPSPVLLVPKLALSFPCDRGPIADQPGATSAPDDFLPNALERVLHAARNRAGDKALAVPDYLRMLTRSDLRV